MHDLVIPWVRSPFSPVDDNSKAMGTPGFSSSGEYCMGTTPASLPSASSSDASGGGGLFATPREREKSGDDDKPLKIKKAAAKKAPKTRDTIQRCRRFTAVASELTTGNGSCLLPVGRNGLAISDIWRHLRITCLRRAIKKLPAFEEGFMPRPFSDSFLENCKRPLRSAESSKCESNTSAPRISGAREGEGEDGGGGGGGGVEEGQVAVCPVCGDRIVCWDGGKAVNDHVDECLTKKMISDEEGQSKGDMDLCSCRFRLQRSMDLSVLSINLAWILYFLIISHVSQVTANGLICHLLRESCTVELVELFLP